MDILDAGTVVISALDFVTFVVSKIPLSNILSIVSGFTHAGIPFVRMTFSNPSLQITSCTETPSAICFLGESMYALIGMINENIKKNVIPRTIFLLIITSIVYFDFYFKLSLIKRTFLL